MALLDELPENLREEIEELSKDLQEKVKERINKAGDYSSACRDIYDMSNELYEEVLMGIEFPLSRKERKTLKLLNQNYIILEGISLSLDELANPGDYK